MEVTMTNSILPSPGFGTFRLKDETVRDAVANALDLGYRHIDTAQIYKNEADVGQVIADSGIARDDIFLTTKVWFDNLDKAQFRPSVEQSLSKLKTSRVDLLLIHWPSPDYEVPMETYLNELKAMQDEGLTRYIGVSNFTMGQLDEAIRVLGEGVLLTNQIEVHPFLPNRAVVDHCKANDITVTGYMPLAVGAVNEDPVLQEIAKEKGVTPAQVALAWINQRDIVTIPSSTKREHMLSNLEAFKLTLTDDEMDRVGTLARDERIANPDFAPEWDPA
jgi:2,5-diketo-D-gluconate reductase B